IDQARLGVFQPRDGGAVARCDSEGFAEITACAAGHEGEHRVGRYGAALNEETIHGFVDRAVAADSDDFRTAFQEGFANQRSGFAAPLRHHDGHVWINLAQATFHFTPLTPGAPTGRSRIDDDEGAHCGAVVRAKLRRTDASSSAFRASLQPSSGAIRSATRRRRSAPGLPSWPMPVRRITTSSIVSAASSRMANNTCAPISPDSDKVSRRSWRFPPMARTSRTRVPYR